MSITQKEQNSPFVIDNKIWDPAEALSRSQLRELQAIRLREIVARVADVPFYRDAFKENNISPDSIQSVDDLGKLPFTNKSDLRDHYPLGFLAVPREKLVRLHGSSGTTGKPTLVGYTPKDMKMWSNICARFLVAGGLRPEHTVQIALGYGLFTGGFGIHYGAEKVGALVIPVGGGNTDRQLSLMMDLNTEVLVSTPSYALYLAEYAKEKGIGPDELPLKYAHFGGEPWTEDMRIVIERQMGVYAFNNYGLSEIIGPGVSGECAARCGMHIQEDHFLVECLNPDTLEPVAEGEQGELVFTTLTKKAMPLIRYRTRDIATLDSSPCVCGRTTARMSRVVGRTDDMVIIRGVNVFPSQIEEALLRVEGTAPHYQIEISRPQALDEITVRVEMRPEDFSDLMTKMQDLKTRIIREIQHVANIRANVELVDPHTLERFQGKAQRVVDNRQKKA